MATRDLERLSARVKQRRLQLGLARLAAARSVGISKDTWKRVEDGLPVRDLNHAKIDRALQWAPGSCARVLEGGEPIEIQRSYSGDVEFAAVPADAMEAEVRQAVQNAMVAGTNLTADKIREVNEIAIRLLRERGMLPGSDEN